MRWSTAGRVSWNYQGLASFGTFSDGTSFRPYAAGLPSYPPLGNTTPQRCVVLQWQFAHLAYDQNVGKITWRSWHGSLLEGKRDRSGLDYRRARVYDPETGRFTQEDPIGLAGGLNLYGFANGDPVNFGDPFGLAVCDPSTDPGCSRIQQFIDWAYYRTQSGTVLNGLAAFDAVVSLFLCSSRSSLG